MKPRRRRSSSVLLSFPIPLSLILASIISTSNTINTPFKNKNTLSNDNNNQTNNSNSRISFFKFEKNPWSILQQKLNVNDRSRNRRGSYNIYNQPYSTTHTLKSILETQFNHSHIKLEQQIFQNPTVNSQSEGERLEDSDSVEMLGRKYERDVPQNSNHVITSSDISEIYNYNDLINEENLKGVGDEIGYCRHKKSFPVYLFRVQSCAACYHYMRNVTGMFGSPSKKWKTRNKMWYTPNGISFEIMVLQSSQNSKIMIFANSSDPSSPLLPSFANDQARKNWMDCCQAAEKCCEKMKIKNSTLNLTQKGMKKCPPTWDSWQCWDEAEAGKIANAPCPHYIYSVLSETSSCSLNAEKTCTKDGTWFTKSGISGEIEWTNYSNCASSVIEVQKRRTYVHVTAYAVSIIAIIPALGIFFAYKQLRVDRIILHQNLLSSMLVNGIFVITFKSIIILNELSSDSSSANTIISENGVGCRLLFILTKYSRMTNYMWMFCEGYYLHKLIASAFAEQKSLLVFYLIGWVFPIIPTIVYGSLRLVYSNERCWVVPEESFEWILNSPSLMSLLINMLFLINIIRVLVTKLRAAHANEPSQYRKAVRATLVLLPLFGCHFLLTIYRPPASGSSGTCEWLEIYFYTNDILDGVQGFLVALIFCYLNGEVTLLLRRTYDRWRDQNLSNRGSSRQDRCRNSRGGSILGRSVLSTHYSSVPASPEVCCNKLSFSSSTQSGKREGEYLTPGLNNSNGLLTPASITTVKTNPQPTTSNNESQHEFEMTLQTQTPINRNGIKSEHQL